MLIGFFKNPADKTCKGRIVQYCDRIWLDEKGDASVFRCFIVEVNKDSLASLSELIMLIPYLNLLNLQDRSETGFNLNFHLNDRGKAGRFKIKESATPITKVAVAPATLGLIDDDGFENIKVFEGGTLSTHRYFNLTLLKYTFPIPIDPGELCEVRMSFNITSLFENMTPGTRIPSFEFLTKYFDAKGYEEALGQIDSLNSEIPVIPTLGAPKGGFDIAVYLPSTFQVGHCNPADVEISSDKTHFDKVGEIFLRRYLWRARKIFPLASELEAGKTPFSLECTNITPPDTIAEDIEEMKQKTKLLDDSFAKLAGRVNEFTEHFMISLGGVKKELRVGTFIAIFGLIIAIVALFISFK